MAGRAGAMIIEKRVRALRPCLSCSKPFSTTIATRLCPRCRPLIAEAQQGAVVPAALSLSRIEMGRD